MFAIKCTIKHVSLAELPEYVAVSYAWGDAESKEQIYLNGNPHSISTSLFGALTALRDEKEEVLVWADALCIDQQNNIEKSNQIKLMTSIYASSKFVAIWLGPKADSSRSAIAFLKDLNGRLKSGERVKSWITSKENEDNLAGVASLFSRSYWKRLWVVQEIFNASDITVYCGSAKISWRALNEASDSLYHYQSEISALSAKNNSRHQLQALFNEGPRSVLDRREVQGHGEEALLKVLRRCRRKFSEKPQDKVFGLLGVLPESIQNDFRVDYNIPVKEVFTDVVDLLISTTKSLDVICESIHFPQHSNPTNLPSWVPDWSHDPITKSLSSYEFSASEDKTTKCRFTKRRKELEISAIYLDTIKYYGVSVGTQCTLADWLMAFLHWRAILLQNFGRSNQSMGSRKRHEEFCRTLNLDQTARKARSDEWMQDCYHVFSSLMRERLPFLEMDPELRWFVNASTRIHPDDRRQFLQEQFGEHMMGRAFCITEGDRMGMGSGALIAGDIIVVPIGCRTPVILREDPFSPSKYRLVGDIYIDKYMYGRAMDLHRLDSLRCKKYVLI